SPIRTTLVVPKSALIELVLASEREAHLILDGVPELELQEGDVVTVRDGAHRFRLAVLEGMNFYDAFRSKFNFMIRPDAVPTLGRRGRAGPEARSPRRPAVPGDGVRRLGARPRLTDPGRQLVSLLQGVDRRGFRLTPAGFERVTAVVVRGR